MKTSNYKSSHYTRYAIIIGFFTFSMSCKKDSIRHLGNLTDTTDTTTAQCAVY